MTKTDIIDAVCEENGFSRRESAKIFETMLEIIKETLENGENVKLAGFGSFHIQHKRARRGRNPQTGEEMTISARRILSFKASNVLREQLNPKK
ncbi:MAG: integration host factor subunit alpha [Deltaproteobacteria bacterium]|nr:integration host factor subunit alpha [Candidatus Tharpella aukensis]